MKKLYTIGIVFAITISLSVAINIFSTVEYSDSILLNAEVLARGETGDLGGPEVSWFCGHWNPDTKEVCFTDVTYCSGREAIGCTQTICQTHQKNQEW